MFHVTAITERTTVNKRLEKGEVKQEGKKEFVELTTTFFFPKSQQGPRKGCFFVGQNTVFKCINKKLRIRRRDFNNREQQQRAQSVFSDVFHKRFFFYQKKQWEGKDVQKKEKFFQKISYTKKKRK